MIRLLILMLAFWGATARAEEIVSGLSQTNVSINANFDGTAILIYGAAMRDAPPPVWPLLQVIVTVEGPRVPIVVRQKERVAGIWINRGSVALEDAPSFYAVMTSGALDEILSPEEDQANHISIPSTIAEVKLGAVAGAVPDYLAALERIRKAAGTYVRAENSVLLLQQSLFRTEVALPSNLIDGDYRVRIFLTRGGKIIDMKQSQIQVRKDGLERILFRMAQDQPLLYGLISLLIAAVAGWGASEAFRRLRL
ncbi:MAG: TIGR02186 family protein [bacterium]